MSAAPATSDLPAAPPLAGQVAVVTGAAGRLGGALARALAAAGVRLGLAGGREDRLDEVAAGARASAAEVVILAGDLTGAGAIAGLADRLEKTFARIDVLVHAAAPDTADPLAVSRALLPLLGHGRAQILFLDLAADAAAEQAQRLRVDRFRDQVNAAGIRVANLHLDRVGGDPAAGADPAALLDPAAVAALALRLLELPRTAEVTDLRLRRPAGR